MRSYLQVVPAFRLHRNPDPLPAKVKRRVDSATKRRLRVMLGAGTTEAADPT